MTNTNRTVAIIDGHSANKNDDSSRNPIRQPTSRLLDVKEVAAMLSLAPKTIYKLVSAKKIPHVKLGRVVRFEYDVVVTWVKESRVSSRGW